MVEASGASCAAAGRLCRDAGPAGLAFFPNRDCVTLKRPVEDESMLQKLDVSGVRLSEEVWAQITSPLAYHQPPQHTEE